MKFDMRHGPPIKTPLHPDSFPPSEGGGGGRTASLRVGTQNKTTGPRFCATIQASFTALANLQPPIFKASKNSLLLLLLLQLAHIVFSCPDTITLITVAKTLVIANPGCFPWTSQGNNHSPNRNCPSNIPLMRVFGSVTAPTFLAYSPLQPQLRESVLQWVPKTRVSAPPLPWAPSLFLPSSSSSHHLNHLLVLTPFFVPTVGPIHRLSPHQIQSDK